MLARIHRHEGDFSSQELEDFVEFLVNIAPSWGPDLYQCDRRLHLESFRGSNERAVPRKCAECGKLKKPTTRYSKSTHGVVYVCGDCIQEVRARSFPHVDALSHADFSHFESNRSRH